MSTRLLLLGKEEEENKETTTMRVEKLRERRARLRDELAKKMSSLMTLKETTERTTTTLVARDRRPCRQSGFLNDFNEEGEGEEEEEVEKRRGKLLLLVREKLRLVEKETERRAALVETLEKALEEEARRNDSMEMNTRKREERARQEARAMAKRAKKNKNEKNNADDVRELIKIRLKSCEFELRCERSRVFRDVKNVFALVESAEATKTPRRTKNRIVSSYGKNLPDVDAFAYSSKQQQQQQQQQQSACTNKEDMDAFIEAIYGDKNENEHEIAATLSMMNRFVTLLGRYSFCPSLHRSTPGVTNATEIWKPVDSTTTSSSRNFERGGKESFDDDDDDYARDEAVKADEFFRKTFGSEEVVVYGDIASPECEILPLYYTRIASKKSDEEQDTRTQKKRFLRALRLLQKSCEILASHLAAEVTELATSDIFDEDEGEENEHQYRYTRRLMRELSGNINNNNNNNNNNSNNTCRSGPFCSLLVAFEALVEIAERNRLRDLYYCSSASSSSSISCEELFSSDDEDNEGPEPVVVVSFSLRNIDNTALSKTTTTKMKSKKSGSRKRQLAEKSKSMIKSVWGFVAEPTKKIEKNLRLARVLENNEEDGDENEEDGWDVVDVPHTLIRKTSSSNSGDSKTKTNIRLPPPPCEEENLDHYVRAMFTDKQ